MKRVTFAAEYRHITVAKTTVYPAGWSGRVTNEIEEAARAAGKLKEKRRGGRTHSRRSGSGSGPA